MPTLVEMRQSRGTLVEQMKALVAKAEGRAMTAEESEAWSKLNTDQEAIRVDVARRERQDALDAELATSAGTTAARRQDDRPDVEVPITRSPEYRAAFGEYLRGGIASMSDAHRSILRRGFRLEVGESRAQGVAPDASGGYTVPEGFSGKLEQEIKYIGGVRLAATIMPTDKGNDLPWPTNDDTANEGEILAEHAPANEQDTVFAVVMFKAFKYSSKMVRVSFELLQDNAINLEDLLPKLLGERIGRITNRHFTTGDGTTQPQGVVTSATLGATGAVGSTLTTPYVSLIDLIHSVDPHYRTGPKVGFMFHDNVLAALQKAVDTQQRPLWQPGLAVGIPDRILGYPYYLNQHMAVPAANAKSVLFGDFSKYIIREVKDVTLLRLQERYAEYHQIAFLCFARYDGRLLDAGTHPIKYYANSATLREGEEPGPEHSGPEHRSPEHRGPEHRGTPEAHSPEAKGKGR